MSPVDVDPRLSIDPVHSPLGRSTIYKVHTADTNGERVYTVTEDNVPVEDHLTLDAAVKRAEEYEAQRRRVIHGQRARGQEVLA